ncbi:hypothetical protein ACOSP7_012476 [Xanthoceras sorbifolium]|uniref:Uncharacterized protein n=1 Tax=Xanthoceras sorbifolium TaxID=99658 RepID=A0ABQ8HY95_9ROSI|nr:hypothetical protein JRO89_XS06G0121000 [Xanthoceras sorbifolium]
MERKSCCGGSSRSYVPSSCVPTTTPKKETTHVMMSTPKKEENVKPEYAATQVGVIQTPKTEEKEAAVSVKQEEHVKVNVTK